MPFAGCPHRCIYCDQHAISGVTNQTITPELIKETVFRYSATRPSWEGERELAFFGGSFTALPERRQDELLEAGSELIRSGRLDSLRISTRPDALSPQIVDRLRRNGVKTVELGVQSMDERILQRARRGHTAHDTIRAARLLNDENFQWIAQIMPGLPGDSAETMIQTAYRVAELAPNGVRIYPTVVIRGTELEDMYKEGDFTPLEMSRAVALLARLVGIFEEESIPVIRLGLHPSEELERRITAGPYHPALGAKVYEARLIEALFSSIDRLQNMHGRVVLRVHPREVSRAIGNRRYTIERLKERYPDTDFTIVGDDSLKRGEVRIGGL